MNDEELSALMDDELAGDATRVAVTDLLASPDARATWGRYHLLGDALRASAERPVASLEPSARADNVVPFPQPTRSLAARGVRVLAAAAAFAAIALIVTRPAPQSGAQSNIAMTVPRTAVKVVAGQPAGDEGLVAEQANGADVAFAPSGVSQTDIIKQDEAQKRLNTYLINFNEQRARQRTPGVHPYVRIVGYDAP